MQLLKLLAVTALVAVMPGHAAAQAASFPNKPVTIVVPFAAGGPPDVIMRALAVKLSRVWNQPVVVDNRTGAAGTIGTLYVARSAPDGYTLVAGSLAHSISASYYRKLTYNPKESFAPVSRVAGTNYVITVNPRVPANTMKELLALDKRKPGSLNYSSSGLGAGNHMTIELLKVGTGATMVHVPFKGSGQAMNAVLAGDVQIGVDGVNGVVGHIRAGKLRPLAVTGSTRSAVLPDVPTLAEAGYPDIEVTPWYGLLAPAGTPKDIVARISGDVAKALREPDIVRMLKDQGAEPVGDTPEQFASFLEKDFDRWARVVKATGLQAD